MSGDEGSIRTTRGDGAGKDWSRRKTAVRRLDPIRSDDEPEFIAQAVQDWIGAVGAKTAYIASGSP